MVTGVDIDNLAAVAALKYRLPSQKSGLTEQKRNCLLGMRISRSVSNS
jgi:hypothetical protein